jgi:LacI family transcriptional regulator
MASRIDVARLAGVTPAVVSYVTNGSHPVSTETRARVVAAIEQLGYRPNAIARSLAKARSDTLGLLLPDSSNPYFAELSSAIEDAAFDAGYAVLLGNGADDVEREIAYVRNFLDHRVDGVIVCPSNDADHVFDELVEAGVPTVTTDRVGRDSAVPSVVVDNRAGAREATRHLIEHGRRVIACVSGGADTLPGQARVAGWHDALGAAGLVAEDELLSFVDFSAESGWRATRELLALRPDIEGLFVASDLQAVGALRALADSGRRAGDDVAVVGFDGIRLGEYISPRLTTAAQPFTAIAKAVITQMLELIDHPGGRSDGAQVLPASLVIRESCGCPPGHPPTSAASPPTAERRPRHGDPAPEGVP